MLLLEGAGPRTIQSLTLVSEIIYGTPSRFTDPARYSFAHGGKDGHPFPVPLKVYDETIGVLKRSIEKAKLGANEKQQAIKQLTVLAQDVEKSFIPKPFFEDLVRKEREQSYKYEGMTVMGKVATAEEKSATQTLLKNGMKTDTKKKKVAFDFVLEELYSLEPTVKPMFGSHAVYVKDKIVLILRCRESYQYDNGVWLATSRRASR